MPRRLVVAAACLPLAACAPTVEPVGFDVDKLDWEQVDAHIDVRAKNPWPVDLKVLEVRYDVRVGDTIVATGKVDTPQVVPAGGRKKVALPLTVDTRSTLDALGAAPGEASENPTTDAIIEGEVTFDTPFGPMPVPISYGEAVPLLTEPTVKKPLVEVKQTNLKKGTVDLVVGFSVDNPNPIDLTVKKVDYGITFSGEPLVEGQRDTVTLSADGTSSLRFPVKVNVKSLGRGAMRAFETGRISGRVWLAGKVQTPWQPIDLDLQRSGKIKVWD